MQGDEVARLTILRDIVGERLRLSQEETDKLRSDYSAAIKAIETERQDQAQTKAYWFVGIMGLAALAFAALAIFVPSVTKWAIRASIAAGVVAALALVFVWLMPYLFWIGLATVALATIAAIVYWRLDAKSRDQVVLAFNKVKHAVPDYKDTFGKVIDHDADLWLDKTRERLGIK